VLLAYAASRSFSSLNICSASLLQCASPGKLSNNRSPHELEQHEELKPWQELVRGLREYFNATLEPFLLYPAEYEQLVAIDKDRPDQEYASIFGPE
jgi:hypothetical protein